MRAVEASVFGCGAGHSDEFGGVAVTADLVFKAAGKANGAFVHRLPSELSHFLNFGLGGNALEVLAHDLFANGRVAGENSDVERGSILLASGDPIGDRPGRFAVGTLHGGSDALSDLRFGERIGVQAF